MALPKDSRFHPWDVIVILHYDWLSYSPAYIQGAVELTFHLLGEGRAAAEAHIANNGAVLHFWEEVQPRMKLVYRHLAEEYPALFQYALQHMSYERKHQLFYFGDVAMQSQTIKDLEAKVGPLLIVPPLPALLVERIVTEYATLQKLVLLEYKVPLYVAAVQHEAASWACRHHRRHGRVRPYERQRQPSSLRREAR